MAEFDTQSGINIGMVQDVQNLDKLRQMSLSKEGKQGALMAAARQFESIFTQTLFKGMRQANSVLTEGNPMNSSYTQFYEGMLDEQRVADMSSKGAGHRRDGGQAALTRADLHPSGWPGTQAAPAYRAGLQALSSPSASNDLIAASKVGKDFADNEMKGELNGAERTLAMPRRPHRTVPPMGSSQRPSALDGSAKVFDSPEEFVDRLMPLAKKAADKLGLSPAVLVAQAAP